MATPEQKDSNVNKMHLETMIFIAQCAGWDDKVILYLGMLRILENQN